MYFSYVTSNDLSEGCFTLVRGGSAWYGAVSIGRARLSCPMPSTGRISASNLSPEFDGGELGSEGVLVDLGLATGGGFPLYAKGVRA